MNTTTPNFHRTWIGLSGKRRSGKDTVAQMMTDFFNRHTPDFPVYHISFGDMIREEYCEHACITPEEYAKNKEHHRIELIKIGERPEYWMQKVFARVNALPHVNSYVIISGVRYLVQANTMLKLGSLLFRVTRHNVPRDRDVDAHRSECELDNFAGWSGIIHNDGCIETLRNRTYKYLDAWLDGTLFYPTATKKAA